MIDFTSEFGQTVKRHIDEEYFIFRNLLILLYVGRISLPTFVRIV